MSEEKIPVKEIGELLDEVSGKVPKLISRLLGTLYSAEAGTQMGQSVGSFYKELIAAGISSDDALKMARDYMLSIKDVLSSVPGNTNAPSGGTSKSDTEE